MDHERITELLGHFELYYWLGLFPEPQENSRLRTKWLLGWIPASLRDCPVDLYRSFSSVSGMAEHVLLWMTSILVRIGQLVISWPFMQKQKSDMNYEHRTKFARYGKLY